MSDIITNPITEILNQASIRKADPSAFTMTQLATANRVYQRSTQIGGPLGTGAGSIPVVINVTKTGNIYARCRAVADGSVIQAPWLVGKLMTTGSQTLSVSSIAARPSAFYLDLSPDNVNWVLGTVPVRMGRIIAISGQSQAVRQIAKVPAYTGTMVSLGVTIDPNGFVYATTDDTSITVSTAQWALPSDAGPYTSTFAAEFLRRQIAHHGVACALVGHAKGDTAISAWAAGTAPRTQLLNILAAVGGFEAFWWHQGGNDAGAGTSKAVYKAALDNLFAAITGANALYGSNYTKVLTAMATRLSAGAGTTANVQAIRQAAKEWANTNSGIYLEPHDLNLEDSVHQGQAGNIILGQHAHRALSSNDIGPLMGTPSRAVGSNIIKVPVTFSNNATAIIVTGNAQTRFTVYPSGTLTNAVSVSSVAWNSSTSTLDLTLGSTPADTQALDVYAFWHPDPSQTLAYANMIRDNNTTDGIPLGRSLEPSTSGPVVCLASVAPTAPGQMVAPTVSAGDGQLIITRGADPSTGGSPITSYQLRYSTDQSTWTVQSFNTTPVTITGLINGTTYYIQERATNAIGDGNWSPSATGAPTAAVVIPFSDTFTGTDGTNLSAHTSDSGHAWTAIVGTMLIGANRAYPSAAPATYRSAYTAASPNAYVQATFKYFTTLASSATWLLCRSTATNTWYQAGYQQAGPSGEGWYIGKTVAGTFTVLGYYAASLSGDHVMRLETQGTTIRLLVDGTQVISVTDSSITAAGNVGIRQGGAAVASATAGIHFDDMTAGVL